MSISWDPTRVISSTKKSIFEKQKNHPISKFPLQNFLILSSTFWSMQSLFHYGAGYFSLHAGKPFPIPIISGFLFTTSSLLISQYASYKASQAQFYNGKYCPSFTNSDELFISKETIRKLYIGLASFMLIEGGMFSIPFTNFFKTSLPTSVISTGAYTNSINKNWLSVFATGEVATEKQKDIIQKIGYRFGCHQCGSRQWNAILKSKSANTFIADHMPPTKFYNEINNRFWRKLLRMKVIIIINGHYYFDKRSNSY